ncbi:SDR family oxidoreductase [Plastorhodobacter daqingensis]|uniref:SDR family oxidoreductase n=1 Tax=Plastorhodobacter daqingensis TaxID=1387281 RepID=A0ABW2UI49_9RHOB
MQDLTGKVALVTGASSGIGRGIAIALAQAGMTVVAAARRQDRLAALAQETSGRIVPVTADVTDEAAVERLFAEADRSGPLSLLVNNAGIADDRAIDDLTLARWREVMDANLTSAFLCSRAAMRRMKAQGGGRIMTIGSLSASIPRAHSPAYTASKFALEGLTRSLALDGRDHLVTAGILHPGATRSELAPGITDKLQGDCLDPAQLGELMTYIARLPPELSLLDATILPVRIPFLGRG